MDSAGRGGRGPVSGPSLKGRFAAAIVLTIAFYTLALAIAAGLLAAAILPWVFNGGNNLWVTITGVLLGGSILWAIVPRRLPFSAPGVRLERETQPRLLAVINEEAEACGERVP
jgi:heat shock protein HtpX